MSGSVDRFDVAVVGAGNAALSAALTALEQGKSVLVLEKAPREWAGGNTYFTAGGFRMPHGGLEDLRPLLPDLTDEEANAIELPPYSPRDFLDDLNRVTDHRCDAELAEVLVHQAGDVIRWLHGKGFRYRLMVERQAFNVDGKLRFWGGVALGTVGGGKGLADQHFLAAERAGAEIRYEATATQLSTDDAGNVDGLLYSERGATRRVSARAVVLACGGFEADPRLRAAYLGPGWDLAKVRGTPFNTGDGIKMALRAGAQPFGHWSGCHSVAWDAAAPATGDRERTNSFTRGSYPIGIVVNKEGRRFLDEGADFRVYTYAKYGGEILRQPGAIGFQLFDAKTVPLLRVDEYADGASRADADSIPNLATSLGINPSQLERTVEEFNAAVEPGNFDPVILDGKGTTDIEPPKSNWAQPLDSPPFAGFPVTCGITFTFGGIRVDADACVLDRRGHKIRGLCAAGELVGGLFYSNYPGGAGLMAGAVLGRRAGISAAGYAGS